MEFKNLKRNLNGSIDGDWAQGDGITKRYTLDPTMGHIEKAEAGRWGEITEPTQAEKDEYLNQQARIEFKVCRNDKVSQIKVTTGAGNCFDGDEESQTRMARAIVGLGEGELLGWVLADNTQVQVNSVELKEALKLAGAAQSALWT